MANKISVILEATTDKAVGAMKAFRSSVAEADGAFGKVKAGSASAFDSIKANAGLAGVAVVGAVGAMAAKSIEAASRLGESVNAVNVTFGKSAEGIKALGEDAAESVGLSNAAFNGLAVQFSSFAETVAGSKGDVVGTMDELTTRIADFASVMDLDVADAAAIFQSSLAGETESIRRFGIDLSAATVETFAYANGFAKVGEKLTEGQKVQARYALLMEKTDKTAGDFANTGDSLANSQRKLAAVTEDTAAKVGKNLAPAMATVTTVLSDMIPIAGSAASAVGTAFAKMADGAYELGQTFTDVIDLIPFLNTSEPIAESLYEQQKLARGTADLVAEYAKGKPTMEAFIAALEGQGLSQHAVNLAIIEYRKQLDGTTTATEGVTGATEDLVEVTDAYTLRTDMASFAIEAKKRADEAAADAAKEHAQAMEEAAEAYVENFEAANTWMGEIGSAMDSAGDAISDFSDEALDDIDTFQQELSDNVAALADWQTNLISIAAATSDEFATYLASLGPEAAGMVADLAGNTPELETTFEQWKFAAAVTGRDMVAEFAKVSPETLAEFETLGRDIASTIEGIGPVTAAEAQAVGKAIAAGMASGIDFNAQAVATAAVKAVRNAVNATRSDLKISSPSQLFADEIGKPIVWGIVEGIDDEEQKLIDAAQQAGEKLVEGFEKAIESSAKDALDAVDDMVDEVADRFDDMWDVVEGRRDIEGLTEGVADAQVDLAEANQKVADAVAEFGPGSEQHLAALERVSDATEKLEGANYRLLKASQDLLDQGAAGEAAFIALGQAAGLEAGEIRNLIGSYTELVAARAAAAAQTDAINTEAAAAQDVRARFGQAAASGLADNWIDHIAQFASDPAFQLELMRQFLATLPNFAGGGIVPGPTGSPQLVVAHGGEEIASNGGALAAGSTVNNVTINMPPGSDGDDVVRAIQKFERRNGPGWRRVS